MHILKHRDLIDVPWKNGGGITRTIAKGTIADQVIWTLSRADVAQDGPFSDFSGMTRVLTVVSGGGMGLDTPTAELDAALWQPLRFDGGLKVWSRLIDGPLTDLNLMFDPTRCEGGVITRRGPFEGIVTRPDSGLLAYHSLSGTPALNAVPLNTGDTAIFDATDATVRMSDGDALLEIRLSYLDQSVAIKLCIDDR